MVSIRKEDVIIPLDVPKAMREQFVKNYFEITKIVKPLSFAGDQKVEHLNDDFYGDWSTLDKLTTKNNINDDFYDDWSTLIKITTNDDIKVTDRPTDVFVSVFSKCENKQQAWTNLIKVAKNDNKNINRLAASVLGSVFSHVPDKQQASYELSRLITDKNIYVRRKATYAIGLAFSNIPDKQRAWNNLIKIASDQNKDIRRTAISSLDSAFPHVSDKPHAWSDLIRLATYQNKDIKRMTASVLGSAFFHVPNKQEAWNDLINLTTERNIDVKRIVVSILYSVFSQVPNKQKTWNDLIKLTIDKDSFVRSYSNHSLGKISISKASQAENDDEFKKELEKAIAFFEKAAQESRPGSHNPAQFCLPFYRSFHTIIFRKHEAKEEVGKYLVEAKNAVKGSESKELLLEAVNNLANALKEVQSLDIDLLATQEELNFYRKYCYRAAELMNEAEDAAPFAAMTIRKGLPILDRNLKELIEEIQEKARIACQVSHGTPTQEIACTVNKEVQKWEISSQEEMTRKVEDIAYILKTKVANLSENEYVLNKIEAMRCQRDLTKQYETLLFVIGLIPTVKVVSDQQLDQKLNPIHYKLDSISYNTNLIFNEIIDIKDKLSNIRFDIFKMKWNSAEVMSNLKIMKEELEKLNKIEGLNTVSIEKLNSNQKDILNELNNNILESLNEIGILAKKLPNKEDTQKILDSVNKLKQSKPEILFKKSLDIIALIGFAIEVFPYLHL